MVKPRVGQLYVNNFFAEKFISGLGDDGEEAVEAIVDDGEQGAEVPNRRNVWKRAKDAWNAGMVGLGGLLTGNRRERETDEERMSRGKKRALGIVAVGTVVGAGFYAWKHGVHVPFTGGGKSGGNSDTINHAVHGRGNGGGNGLLDVAGRPKAGNEAAQRAWYDALSPEGKTQFARMNGWESDYIRLHGGTWDDAAKAFEKFMNGQG